MNRTHQAPCRWTRFFVAASAVTVVVMTAGWLRAETTETAYDVSTGEAVELECRVIDNRCHQGELWQEGRPDETVLICEQVEVCKVAS